MRRLLAMGVMAVSISVFGTGFAQNTTQPAQAQPNPALEKRSPKTTPSQRTNSAGHAEQYKTEDEAKSQCGTDQVVWGNTHSAHPQSPPVRRFIRPRRTGSERASAGLSISGGMVPPAIRRPTAVA